MEHATFTPLVQYIPESSMNNSEMMFLDNFDLEGSPDLRRVLGSLSKIEISPDHTLIDKLIHYSKNPEHNTELP